MAKWHANVAHMAKHMNMVGALGHLGPPKSGAAQLNMAIFVYSPVE